MSAAVTGASDAVATESTAAAFGPERKQEVKRLFPVAPFQGFGPRYAPLERLADVVDRLAGEGKVMQAFACLRSVQEAQPEDPMVIYLIGVFTRNLGLPENAVECFQVVERMLPGETFYINEYGLALHAAGLTQEAIRVFTRGLEQDPLNHHFWNNVGMAVAELPDFDKAIMFFNEALRLKADYGEAYANLGEIYAYLGRFEDSLVYVEKAHQFLPDRPHITLNLAFSLLRLGKLKEGWRVFNIRLHPSVPGSAIFLNDFPRYDGRQLLPTERLLVMPEQGVGDMVMYASVLPDLLKRAPNVVIESDPRLVTVFQRSFPECSCIPAMSTREMGKSVLHYDWASGPARPDFAIHIAGLMELFRSDIDSFPREPKPYIVADPERVAYWRQHLDKALKPGLRVGVCWRSGLRSPKRRKWYLDILQMGEVFALPGISWVNLQYDECQQELDEARAAFGVEIYNPPGIDQKQDIEGAMALIDTLDVVLTVGTAVRSFAGGLGKPTILLTPCEAWTTFRTGREPLQPAVTIYQSHVFGDWDEVLHLAAADLRHRLAGQESRAV